MTWKEFNDAVRELLHVHSARAGIQPLIDRKIKAGVVVIQRYIDYYRTGQQTTYLPGDLVAQGFTSVGTLPHGAMPTSAEYMSATEYEGEDCDRHPLYDYPYENVRDLICGKAPITNCRYWIAFDRYGTSFNVYPEVEDGKKLVIVWDGLKTDFADDDDVTFDNQVAEAVAEYVLITLAGEIDKNIQQREEHKVEFLTMRKQLYLDALDKKRLRDTKPSPFPKSCNTMGCSTCSQLSSAIASCKDCFLHGAAAPEGIVEASVGQSYIRDDGANYELWLKRTGDRTKTGWVEAVKFQ